VWRRLRIIASIGRQGIGLGRRRCNESGRFVSFFSLLRPVGSSGVVSSGGGQIC
jgi:hypothetical protein